MLTFTRHELDGMVVVTAATVLVLILVSAWSAWLQERDTGRLRDEMRDEVDELRAWCHAAAHALGWTDDDPGDGGEGPPPDEPDPTPPGDDAQPDTVVSHPADMFARKAALLAHRYVHTGQHRG